MKKSVVHTFLRKQQFPWKYYLNRTAKKKVNTGTRFITAEADVAET